MGGFFDLLSRLLGWKSAARPLRGGVEAAEVAVSHLAAATCEAGAVEGNASAAGCVAGEVFSEK